MKRRKALLIINGTAGTGGGGTGAYDIICGLVKGGCEVTVYPLLFKEGLSSETIFEEIKEKGEEFDLIVCAGGDGTLNHVITCMVRDGITTPLGYIPAGSTNDFARSLGIPADLEENCAAITGGVPFAYDIGSFNDRYFNYVAAFGAFTSVSYQTDQTLKNALGHAGYILNAALSLPENLSYSRRVKVTLDGTVLTDNFVFGSVSNATSVGGFSAPDRTDVSMDDGLFEIMLIRAPKTAEDLGGILQAFALGDTDNPYVHFFHAEHVVFESRRKIPWTLDGEFGGAVTRAEIGVLKKRIRIMVKGDSPQGLIKTKD